MPPPTPGPTPPPTQKKLSWDVQNTSENIFNKYQAGVFPRSTFDNEIGLLLRSYSQLPMGSLMAAKKLVRESESEDLHRTNKSEVAELRSRWRSEECMQAVLSFFQNKAKL